MPPSWKKLIDNEDIVGLTRWLEDGGGIDDPDPGSRHTPLEHAAHQGKLEVVRFLLERGADRGKTSAALMGAAIGCQFEVVRLLLSREDDVDQLREVLGVVRFDGGDEELIDQIKARIQELKQHEKPKRAPARKTVKRAGKASQPKKRRRKEDERGPEALAWIRKNGDKIPWGRFASKDEAVAFVEELYAAGAESVLVPKDRLSEADSLLVLLPAGATARERLLAIVDRENEDDSKDLALSIDDDSAYLCWYRD